MKNSKRIFAAIKVKADSDFVQLFDDLRSNLKHENIKWIDPNNLHLTLKFFGKISIEKIPKIIIALEDAISKHHEFSFSVEKTGIFGSRYEPRVIWAGISNTKPIIEIEKSITSELEKIDIHKDRQNFIPHLTLGRIKQLSDKQLFQKIISSYKEGFYQEVNIEFVYLLESILTKTGPIYKVVREFKL